MKFQNLWKKIQGYFIALHSLLKKKAFMYMISLDLIAFLRWTESKFLIPFYRWKIKVQITKKLSDALAHVANCMDTH